MIEYEEITEISFEEVRDIDVYNFEVKDYHSYTANGIGVHNCARTETTNVINIGMADRIVKMNPELSSKNTIVFKRVVNDSSLCPHCRRLHLESDGVTPKIYTLEEALANGSNVGRKVADWKFTITVVHPFCRCQLSQIPPGYILNSNGVLEFAGQEAYEEYIKKHL